MTSKTTLKDDVKKRRDVVAIINFHLSRRLLIRGLSFDGWKTKCILMTFNFLPNLLLNAAAVLSPRRTYVPVWPNWAIYWTLGNFWKPLATINLSKYPTFLSNFCKGVKIYHFSSEIILGNFLDIWQFFSGHTHTYPHFLIQQRMFSL